MINTNIYTLHQIHSKNPINATHTTRMPPPMYLKKFCGDHKILTWGICGYLLIDNQCLT